MNTLWPSGTRLPKLIQLFLAGLLAATTYSQQPPNAAPPAGAQAPSTSKPEVVPSPASIPAPAPSPPPDTVILKVGDQKVTRGDFDALLTVIGPQAQRMNSGQAKRSVAEQLGMLMLLAQQAEKDKLDSTPAFQKLMEFSRLQVLARAEYEAIQGQAKVTPEEVSQYYSTHQPEFEEASLRQVVILKKPEGGKEDLPGLPAPEAHTMAESIRKALQSGKDWKDLQKDFNNPAQVRFEPEPRKFRRGQLPADWDKIAFELKEGQVSPALENAQVIVLFQSVSHKQQDMKEVSTQIGNSLRQQSVQSTLDALKQKNPIWLDDNYFGASPQAAAPPAPKELSKTPPPKP